MDALTQRRQDALRTLAANTKSPALAEMARDLIAGRITPAQAMSNESYGAELSKGVTAFTEWRSSLSASEHEQVLADARAQLEPPTPPTPAPPSRRSPRRDDPDEDNSGVDTWLELA